MSDVTEVIGYYYSRLPFLPIPNSIYITPQDDVRAQNLYYAAHQHSAMLRSQGGYSIYGMHAPGTDYIFVAGNAPASTSVHEAVHNMGVHSEAATRAITNMLMMRASMNLGLFSRPIQFTEESIPAPQSTNILRNMGLVNPNGGPTELLRLSPIGIQPGPIQTYSEHPPEWYLEYHPELVSQ